MKAATAYADSLARNAAKAAQAQDETASNTDEDDGEMTALLCRTGSSVVITLSEATQLGKRGWHEGAGNAGVLTPVTTSASRPNAANVAVAPLAIMAS